MSMSLSCPDPNPEATSYPRPRGPWSPHDAGVYRTYTIPPKAAPPAPRPATTVPYSWARTKAPGTALSREDTQVFIRTAKMWLCLTNETLALRVRVRHRTVEEWSRGASRISIRNHKKICALLAAQS